MQLAADHIVTLGTETVTLRPTLRACMRLERKYGYANLLRQLLDINTASVVDVLTEAGVGLPSRSIPALLTPPLPKLEQAIPALCDFVFVLAGMNEDKPETDGEKMPFAEYHARLFSIATGWLGWTPTEAWNATPAEITAAYKGKIEMLRAMSGQAPEPTSDQKVASFLHSLPTRVVRPIKRAA